MNVECAAEIAKMMELCDEKQIGQVIRVIPDPKKDIGLNIISFFHYAHRPPTTTCKTMGEVAKLLSQE